jgi:mannose-6-phosphate isomerase
VNSGDIVDVPAGTVHALTNGLLILEIQQPIDLTYRLYDYNRNAVDRKLHIEQSINSSNIPSTYENIQNTNELDTQYFSIRIIENKHTKIFHFDNAK